MKIIIAALMLSVSLTAALAFNFGGDGSEFGHMGASVGAGTANPVGCTNQLNFSVACNSQYIAVIH